MAETLVQHQDINEQDDLQIKSDEKCSNKTTVSSDSDISSTTEIADKENHPVDCMSEVSSHLNSDLVTVTAKLSKSVSDPIVNNGIYQYSKEKLDAIRNLPLSRNRHASLSEKYINLNGKWCPDRWFYGCDEFYEKDRGEQSDRSFDPSYRRKIDVVDKNVDDDIKLTPQRKTFGAGCHVTRGHGPGGGVRKNELHRQHSNPPTSVDKAQLDANERENADRFYRAGGREGVMAREVKPTRSAGFGRGGAFVSSSGGNGSQPSGPGLNADEVWEGRGRGQNRYKSEHCDRSAWERPSYGGRNNYERNGGYSRGDDSRYSYNRGHGGRGHHRDSEGGGGDEPEWFTEGPSSQHETMVLRGFSGDQEEDGDNDGQDDFDKIFAGEDKKDTDNKCNGETKEDNKYVGEKVDEIMEKNIAEERESNDVERMLSNILDDDIIISLPETNQPSRFSRFFTSGNDGASSTSAADKASSDAPKTSSVNEKATQNLKALLQMSGPAEQDKLVHAENQKLKNALPKGNVMSVADLEAAMGAKSSRSDNVSADLTSERNAQSPFLKLVSSINERNKDVGDGARQRQVNVVETECDGLENILQDHDKSIISVGSSRSQTPPSNYQRVNETVDVRQNSLPVSPVAFSNGGFSEQQSLGNNHRQMMKQPERSTVKGPLQRQMELLQQEYKAKQLQQQQQEQIGVQQRTQLQQQLQQQANTGVTDASLSAVVAKLSQYYPTMDQQQLIQNAKLLLQRQQLANTSGSAVSAGPATANNSAQMAMYLQQQQQHAKQQQLNMRASSGASTVANSQQQQQQMQLLQALHRMDPRQLQSNGINPVHVQQMIQNPHLRQQYPMMWAAISQQLGLYLQQQQQQQQRQQMQQMLSQQQMQRVHPHQQLVSRPATDASEGRSGVEANRPDLTRWFKPELLNNSLPTMPPLPSPTKQKVLSLDDIENS